MKEVEVIFNTGNHGRTPPPHKARLKVRGKSVNPRHDDGGIMVLTKEPNGYALRCPVCGLFLPLEEKNPVYVEARACGVDGE